MDAMRKRLTMELKRYVVQRQMFCPVTKLCMDFRRVSCVQVKLKGGDRVFTLWLDDSYESSPAWTAVLPKFDTVHVVPDDKLLDEVDAP